MFSKKTHVRSCILVFSIISFLSMKICIVYGAKLDEQCVDVCTSDSIVEKQSMQFFVLFEDFF